MMLLLYYNKNKYNYLLKLSGDERWNKVFSIASKKRRCGEDSHNGCGCLQPKLKKEGLATLIAEWNEKEDKSVLPTAQGYSKAYAAQDLKSELRKKYDIKLSIHGITSNPPLDIQKELGFDKVAEPRRNKTYDEETWKKSGKMHYRPFVNVDKKFVADLYKQFDLMEDLFPLTMSCIGFSDTTNFFTEPCKECYWCHEKMWAFGCYDGGLLE